MRAHARLAPSAASRWLRCAGSVNFIDDMDEVDEGGLPADEGTIFHSVMEDALRSGREAYSFIGETREYGRAKITIDDDHADMLQEGLDTIDEYPGKLHVEHRVNLKRWLPGDFGTLDVGCVGRDLIIIHDHKFGYNPVSPVENDQLRLYALGFWDNVARHISDATRFRLIIWQPRAPGGGGEWDVDLDDLLEFGRYAKKQGRLTQRKDAPRVPGSPQCDYCPGAKTLTCREYVDFNTNMVLDEFDDIDEDIADGVPPKTPSVKGLTPERKCFLVEHRAMFEKFLDRVHADVLADALAGRPTPGLKAVKGRNPPRKWRDEAAVEAILTRSLGDDAYSRKLLSPARAEKELPPKLFSKLGEHVDDGVRKTVLVHEDDRRDAVRTFIDMFDDLD